MGTPRTVKSFVKNSSGHQRRFAESSPDPRSVAWHLSSMNRLQFITAIPADIRRGSGCYVGTRLLAEGLLRLRNNVEVVRPRVQLPNFTATRILFNEALRARDFCSDATIGIDADGYSIAGRRNSPPHIACI